MTFPLFQNWNLRRNTVMHYSRITGSNEPNTLLTHHILKNAGLKVGLAGNIGTSLT